VIRRELTEGAAAYEDVVTPQPVEESADGLLIVPTLVTRELGQPHQALCDELVLPSFDEEVEPYLVIRCLPELVSLLMAGISAEDGGELRESGGVLAAAQERNALLEVVVDVFDRSGRRGRAECSERDEEAQIPAKSGHDLDPGGVLRDRLW
jgi:hypothetical protein